MKMKKLTGPDRPTRRRCLAAWQDTPEDYAYLRSVAQALILAQQHPVPLKGCLTPAACKGYHNFVTAVGWLAVVECPEPFPLPREKLAALFGHHTSQTVSIWTGWAVQDGLLRMVKRAGAGKPALYEFDIRRFSILEDRT
jgi:hypothetical protein